MSYEYNFNVPAYDQPKFDYETTFFEYNGTNYNSAGKVINTVPTGLGSFSFNFASPQKVIRIIVAGYEVKYEVTNQNINQLVDKALKTVVNASKSYLEKNDIIQKAQNGDIRYEIVNAVPFGTKAKFASSRVRWTQSDSHEVSHYFDFNFLFTYNNNYDSTTDYLNGLRGSTAYTNVKVDLYGAAYNDGEWSGSRLIQDK